MCVVWPKKRKNTLDPWEMGGGVPKNTKILVQLNCLSCSWNLENIKSSFLSNIVVGVGISKTVLVQFCPYCLLCPMSIVCPT